MQDLLKSVLSFSIKALILLVMLLGFSGITYFVLIRPAYKNLIQQQLFTVDGTAKKYQKPDLAVVSVSALFTGTDAASIKKDADKALTGTTNELIALGIPEEKIHSDYSVQPKYDSKYENIIGYTVNAKMEVKTNDFTQVDKILESAQKNKLILVNSVSFTLEDPIKAKEELRTEAIAAAKAKAQKLAKETGISLGQVININEGYYPYYSTKTNSVLEYAPDSSRSTEGTGSSFNPGETEVQMTVTLTYELN